MATTSDLLMTTLARSTAERYGDDVAAARFLVDGEWQSMSYTELAARVRAVAHGLIGLGVEVGDRVAVLCGTRVEFTIAQLGANAAGAIAVPVYPTSSADECRWVVGDAGARVIVCENGSHVAKIESVRADLPELEHVVVIEASSDGGEVTFDGLVAQGEDGDDSELEARAAHVKPDDPCLIVYTSGTTGRPKGVVLGHQGFAAGRRISREMGLINQGDTIYLYLPLAHVFAQLMQAAALEVGCTIAYWGGDPTRIVSEFAEVRPNMIPSVPRIFEKVYAAASAMIPPEQQEEVRAAIDLGVRVREARARGEEVSEAEAAAFEKADAELFPLVRGIFGGEVTLAITGAAPIAPEILRFFFATGVPVMEGWGMTETTAIGTVNLVEAHKFGTIGRPIAGADIRIADDGEIEIKGDILLKEYWNNPKATADVMTPDGYLRTGDLGSIDEDGYVTITGRKKDIIITAGGKNLTPANLEGELRRSRWISQAVMYGDRRPYPVAVITLDAEEVVPWAEAKGYPTDPAALAHNEELIAMIQEELDKANANYAGVEQIKRFKILERDFTLDHGELTPSLKLKRNVIFEQYADDFAELYEA